MKKKYLIDIFMCPDCGQVFKYKRRIYFDAQKDRFKRKQLEKWDMFKVVCPKCKEFHFVRDFVYENKKKGKVIFLNKEEFLDSVYKSQNYNPYDFYGVTDLYDLKNCIYCIENDLNWYIAKLYITAEKYWYLEDCKAKNMPNPIIEQELLIKLEGQNQLYLSLKNYDHCRRLIFSPKLYDTYVSECSNELKNYLNEHFYLDEKNALEILNKVGFLDGD